MANETLSSHVEEGWKMALAEEFGAEYMKELKKKLVEEMKAGIVLYLPAKQIFNARNGGKLQNKLNLSRFKISKSDIHRLSSFLFCLLNFA